jgi:serine/threonine-protein kinase
MPSPQVGQVVNNKYRLLRHLGDGGMGAVYEARHETLGTTVALKFLHLEFARREGLVQRFLQEARASARIQSTHVVRVTDVDQTPDGDVFIVLEYLEGKTLQALYDELQRAGRKLPYADALSYAGQMLDGVEAAHAAGIVHRDLKPDNVMITVDAKGATVIKLLDFGIAKLKVLGLGDASNLTRPGVMMGTPEYMAPEQATSADLVDARADLFSLGVMIFEMLAGQRPVGGNNPLELAAAYRRGGVSRLADLVPGIAPALASAVHRALAADPKDRFSTATEMREAISPFAAAVRPPPGGTIGVSAAPPEVAPKALPPPPPPTAESRPLGAGVSKTWPPDGPPPDTVADPRAAAAAAAAPPAGTVVEDPAPAQPALQRGETHRIEQPYAPALSPIATAPLGPAGTPFEVPKLPMGGGSPYPSAQPVSPRRGGRRSGFSIGGVLVSAACVAGLAMGVAFLASRGSSSSSKDDEPTQGANAPEPTAPGTAAPQTPPQQADPPPYVPPPSAPSAPARPGRGGRSKPAPSGSSSADPNPPPPAIVIPSALPFPLPFE